MSIDISRRTSPDLMLHALMLQVERPNDVPPPLIVDRECGAVDCLFESRAKRLLIVIRSGRIAFRGVTIRNPELHVEGNQAIDAPRDWLWSWFVGGGRSA